MKLGGYIEVDMVVFDKNYYTLVKLFRGTFTTVLLIIVIRNNRTELIRLPKLCGHFLPCTAVIQFFK